MSVRIRLEPLGTTLEAEPGTPLRDLLFPYGIEFPCGGRGVCRGCRVRLATGAGEPSTDDRRTLRPDEIARGWRLACRTVASRDVVLEVEQWASAILADDSPLHARASTGVGIAVDVGTTTLVAQLVDLAGARVLGVRTALNPQAPFGADVMTRIQAALTPDGARALGDCVRAEVGRMVAELCDAAPASPARVVLVGNTAMQHLFCGLDVTPLSAAPFESPTGGQRRLAAGALGWAGLEGVAIDFLSSVGGFVGSDVLAGIGALGLASADALTAFIDLGTNAEIVVGTRDRLLCASTAAGPAFEGGRISQGMRASTGAVCEVTVLDGSMAARVIGGGRARGLCGSGLVDAVRCGLELGWILPSGRLAHRARTLPVCGGVSLTQADVRELQLAKAAIAAGLETLLARLGRTPAELDRVYLAGAFGNYVSRESACRIGLLAVDAERIHPAGNTALRGAKLALFARARPAPYASARSRIEHVALATDPAFVDAYVAAMAFPR